MDVIKSPWYTWGDFMFLYWFVYAAAAATDFCSRHNFLQTFWISFIFGMVVGPDP